MAEFSFESNIGDRLTIRFDCDKCGEQIIEKGIEIPEDVGKDLHHKCNCKQCGTAFTIQLLSDGLNGKGVILELPKNYSIDCNNVHWEYCIGMDTSFFFLYDGRDIIETSLKEIESLDDKVKQYLYRLIYVNMFSLLESFVKQKIKNKLQKSPEKFKVSQKGNYLASSLNEQLGEELIKEDEYLSKIYQYRNKIVHENAVLPYGDSVIVNHGDLSTLIEHVFVFAKQIDRVLSQMEVNAKAHSLVKEGSIK